MAEREVCMKIHHEATFACAPSALFEWLAEPEKAKAWMKTVLQTEITKSTDEKVGTTFTEVVGDGKGQIHMTGTITAYIENKLIAFHLESRVNQLDVEYTIDEIDTGTRLSIDSTIHWKFPINIASVFMGNKIRAGVIAQLRDELSELEKLCG